jgi:hypothetical protein
MPMILYIWRDGLLYVLWQKGIRGKLWHYIRDFYCSSKRRVQYNMHLSKCSFTLTWVLPRAIPCHVSFLTSTLMGWCSWCMRNVQACRCRGKQAKVAALLFADDFTGFICNHTSTPAAAH